MGNSIFLWQSAVCDSNVPGIQVDEKVTVPGLADRF
jgi:hypothetical protein